MIASLYAIAKEYKYYSIILVGDSWIGLYYDAAISNHCNIVKSTLGFLVSILLINDNYTCLYASIRLVGIRCIINHWCHR